MIKKIKNFYQEPPKKNIWFYLFMILFLKQFIMGQTLYVVLFQLGALQPELSTKSFMPKIESVAETSINNLINPLTRIFESGQNLSRNNPTLGNFVAHFISYIYVAFWLSILSYAFFGVFRYLIHSIYVFLKEKRTLK